MAAVILRPYVNKVKIPTPGDKIYKEECVFCFDTPESGTGLYVCLSTFLGFSRKHVEQHFSKTGNAVFLLIKREKKEVKTDPVSEAKPTKLAIGLEGGFDVGGKKYEFTEHYTVVILPDFIEIPLPCPDIPESVQLSITTILASDAASKVEEAQALAGTWDGMQREVTKHASTLHQMENGVRIPPKGWKCEECGLMENLWLNLTDGSIHCGRKYFNNLGGNNHAVEHYNKTKFPLVVKLGTITSEAADVYSYDEDSMVLDPNLPSHLTHFGININQLEKTDKSMIELEIDMNQRIGEWSLIQESGSPLVPLYGPGYTGLTNLGNSCYLNSVMQVLFTVPDFQQKYFAPADEIFARSLSDPTSDFTVQMVKLACGILSGEYSKPPNEPNEEHPGIKPTMFKSFIGQGHVEFSTKRQQDAQEFFLHLITVIERHSRNQESPTDALKFQVEERTQCIQSGKVMYNTRADYHLSLPIVMEAATNADEVAEFEKMKAVKVARGDRLNGENIVRPKIPLQACLESFSAKEIVDDFFSSALNAKSTAYKTIRMHTFPDYLMLHMKKFTIGDDWVPKKLDVSIDVPDELDLSWLRGGGKQPNEELLPEITTTKEFQFDETSIAQLTETGFPFDACKRALFYANGSVEMASEWLMEHIGDDDFNDPFNPTEQQKVESNFVPDQNALLNIVSMGFTDVQATKALQATDNNIERAVDWIFSHANELTEPSAEQSTEQMDCSENEAKFRDGSEKYELVAFISHMGTSTVAGHYVCHIKKEGRWVIYNDNKVALSEHPPKDLAYMYLYQRKSGT